MPLAGYPNIASAAEFSTWMNHHGHKLAGPAFRDAYWAYVKARGGPDFKLAWDQRQPKVAPPPIPDSVNALLTQQNALPDIYNPQRHTIAAGTSAQLEGQGYADPGTATITEQHATGPNGTQGPDIRYLVFQGTDGRLYRQAYLTVQNTGAQKGSLYTSGTADEEAQNKQHLDYQRQGIIQSGDTAQTTSLGNEQNQYTTLGNQYQSGVEAWQQAAPSVIANSAPPPPTAPTHPVVGPPPPRILTAASFRAYQAGRGKTYTNPQFRDAYWAYRAAHGSPVPGSPQVVNR